MRGYDTSNRTTTFIERSLLDCPISIAVAAVAVAANAAAASTTNEALYLPRSLPSDTVPKGAGLWVAARASVDPNWSAVQQPQCSSSDRSRADPELVVVPYQFRSGRTDLGVGVRTTGSAVLHRLSPTTTLRGLADYDDYAFDFPFLAGTIRRAIIGRAVYNQQSVIEITERGFGVTTTNSWCNSSSRHTLCCRARRQGVTLALLTVVA